VTDRVTKQASEVKLIVFACEAGMGSSLMGANQLKKMVKRANLDVTIVHAPVHEIPVDTDVILTHTGLAARAHEKAPGAAIVPFTMFFNDPVVKTVVDRLAAGEAIVSEL